MKLTDFQLKQKAGFLAEHQPPEGLSSVAKAKYLKAVSKVTFTPTNEGGLTIGYEQLSKEELFAIQEPWGVFTPDSVNSKMKATLPRDSLGGIHPADEATQVMQRRLITELRKDVLVLAHGETFKAPKEKGEKAEKTILQDEYIKAQILGNPDAKAFTLHQEADKNIIGDMSFKTYEGRLTEVKKQMKAASQS